MAEGKMDRREFLEKVAALGGGAAALAVGMEMIGGVESRALAAPAAAPTPTNSAYLETSNGWYTHNGKVVWGYAHHNHWWGGYRGAPTGWWTDADLSPSLIRNDPGKIGLNRTEDLGKLTDSMLEFGFPGFEHTPPLWYDRRRDAHDITKRPDGNVVGPTLEMPWGRSDQGQAWDGKPLYDLTKFNPWYFKRVRDFADECDRKGSVLFFNCYHQHNLLETQAHYADYPWRPVNCVQKTGLPDTTPVANVFYDVTDPVRRDLHQRYIRQCLDNLSKNRNVVFLTGSEFTGPLAFMRFWFDTILEWEKDAGRKVHIGLGATKDVTDAMLGDEKYKARIATIDARRWSYKSDGTLNAPAGGQEIPGRYISGGDATKPGQTYKLIREYRDRYPDKAIVHVCGGNQNQNMAFLMAGGSMIIHDLSYAREYPQSYNEMPLGCDRILPTYDFIRQNIAEDLTRMRPLDVIDKPENVWCMGEKGESYLIYMPYGNQWFKLDLSDAPGTFDAKWVGMRTGKVFTAQGPYHGGPPEGAAIRCYGGSVEGGKAVSLSGLDWRPWLLWLKKRA